MAYIRSIYILDSFLVYFNMHIKKYVNAIILEKERRKPHLCIAKRVLIIEFGPRILYAPSRQPKQSEF